MSSSNRLPVIVWIPEEECYNGTLRIERDGISIRLENGKVLTSKVVSNAFYRLQEASVRTENKILFDPVLIINRPYMREGIYIVEDVFPPSTEGFYGRMKSGKENAVYIIQEIEKDSRLWLLIGNPKTGEIFETQIIQAYEAEAIKLLDNGEHMDLWNRSLIENEAEYDRTKIVEILNGPSPSWEEVSKLIIDVNISNLKIGESMRDTLSQLIPNSFPDIVREELMVFFALVNKSEILKEDPVDFAWQLYPFQSVGNLIRGHLRCVVNEAKWPPYVKYLRLAEREQLQRPIVALDAHVESPWDIFRQKANEAFPNWIGIAITSAKELTKAGKVITKMPASRSRAKRSQKIWRKRLAAVSYGLRIRGHINANAIGLTDLIYLGAAYRWPHRHMKFITRLDSQGSNPPHLHVMTMPQTAAERVKRVLPNIVEVEWSARTINLDLYDYEVENWNVNVSRIIESIDRIGSRKKLVKQFTRKLQLDTYQMTRDEAKVAGLVSRGIFLVDFEREGRFSYLGLDGKRIHSILVGLYNRGVIDITYSVGDERLVSIATIAQGEPRHITSLTEAFLSSTPTSLAMLGKNSEMGVILSTLPEEAAFDLVTGLPRYGIQKDVIIRCMRPTVFSSFTFDLYHRLLREDGTWDDDVSAFLSQARSKRKELSESNA